MSERHKLGNPTKIYPGWKVKHSPLAKFPFCANGAARCKQLSELSPVSWFRLAISCYHLSSRTPVCFLFKFGKERFSPRFRRDFFSRAPPDHAQKRKYSPRSRHIRRQNRSTFKFNFSLSQIKLTSIIFRYQSANFFCISEKKKLRRFSAGRPAMDITIRNASHQRIPPLEWNSSCSGALDSGSLQSPIRFHAVEVCSKHFARFFARGFRNFLFRIFVRGLSEVCVRLFVRDFFEIFLFEIFVRGFIRNFFLLLGCLKRRFIEKAMLYVFTLKAKNVCIVGVGCVIPIWVLSITLNSLQILRFLRQTPPNVEVLFVNWALRAETWTY